MNTGEILLAVIRADPDDDLPRLAYADWCEETGQDAHAELIRVQLRQEKVGEPECNTGHGSYAAHRGRCQKCTAIVECEWHTLAARASRLIGDMPPLRFARGLKSCGWIHHVAQDPYLCVPFRVIWHRGFPRTVRCPMGAWDVHCGALARFPLERVEITDRKPLWFSRPGYAEWLWFLRTGIMEPREDHLEWPVFRRLPDAYEGPSGSRAYSSASIANDACSVALILEARDV